MKQRQSWNNEEMMFNKWEECKMKKKVFVTLASLTVLSAAVAGLIRYNNSRPWGHGRLW